MSDVNFDLLDDSIDELADLQAFEPIPAGTHALAITWDTKDINGKPAVIMGLKVLETLEMADSSQEPPEVGKTSDIAFLLLKDDGTPNTMGQGQFKEIISVLAEHCGGETARQTMEESEGAEIVGTLKIRVDKKDDTKKYNGFAGEIAMR